MRKNLRFIWLLIKYKFSRMMVFRADFFLAFFGDSVLFLVQLLTFETIYSHVDFIGGWTRGQMIIFVGTFSMINALNMVIYFFGIVDLHGKIRRGDLDQYLTKPVNPLLRLTFEEADPGSLPLILLSGGIIAYGVKTAELRLTAPLLLLYIFLILIMTLLWYDMQVILRTFSFFFPASNAIDPISRIEGSLLNLNFKIPGVIYKGVFKVLFYFVLPYGIMATIPAQALTRMLTFPAFLYALGIVALFTALTLWFWRFGTKHYKSASS